METKELQAHRCFYQILSFGCYLFFFVSFIFFHLHFFVSVELKCKINNEKKEQNADTYLLQKERETKTVKERGLMHNVTNEKIRVGASDE